MKTADLHSSAVFVTLPKVERRKVLRREVNFEVAFSTDGARGTTLAKQLSEFGMLIGPVDHPRLLLEKHIQLQFALPGQEPCKVRGFCAYVTPSSAGIRFETIPDELKHRLSRFVNEDTAAVTKP
jgi:hypothetical protein